MIRYSIKSITFVAPRNGRATANAIAHPKIEEGIEPSPILPRNEQCSDTAFAPLSTLLGMSRTTVNRFRNCCPRLVSTSLGM